MKNNLSLALGTAMWGWTTDEKTAFELLDAYYQMGHRAVDAATNYPINRTPKDWRKSEKILLNWINTNGIHDLEVMMKVGSLDNMRSPDHNLSPSFLLMNLDHYQMEFDDNLKTYMIHWDNRKDANVIEESLSIFEIAKKRGLNVGFSGVQSPEIYYKIGLEKDLEFHIQFKHNLLQSDYERYNIFHGARRFIAYGINAGGIKLNTQKYHSNSSLKTRNSTWQPPDEVIIRANNAINLNNKSQRPPLSTFNELGMINCFYHPDISSVLLGTSSVMQLKSSLDFMEQMKEYDYGEVYDFLNG